MAGETLVTVIGNITSDPELRWVQSGNAVASFTIASTPRAFDRSSNSWKDGETLFMRCSAWGQVAENVAESLKKGTRVIARGRLQQRSYDDKQGQRRTVVEMTVDEVGPSLRFATAQVSRNPRGEGGFGNAGSAGGYGGSAGGYGNPADPYANQGGSPAPNRQAVNNDAWDSPAPQGSTMDDNIPF